MDDNMQVRIAIEAVKNTSRAYVLLYDISRPIDIETSTQLLCGRRDLFYMMLGKFEDMSLLTPMKDFADTVSRLQDSEPEKEA